MIKINECIPHIFPFYFSWQPIVDYIESKYEEYLNAESRVQRQPMRDNRVHVCLYFIQPSGHGLKPLDIEFMKRLHDKVNIIPVLAKADTMTPDECAYFKKQVRPVFFLLLFVGKKKCKQLLTTVVSVPFLYI